MTQRKKRTAGSRLIFLLIVLSVFGICHVILRDFNMTPAELFETAQTAQKNGSYRKAERYYLRATTAGNPNVALTASYYLGNLYRTGGDGFPINGQKAEMFLEQAALKNMPQAQYDLALMYDTGDKIKANREKAIKLMQSAVDNNYPDAFYSMAVWIERGYLGKPDMQQAIALYEKAAIQGNVYAMTSLITLYGGSAEGVEPNPERASFWKTALTEINKALKPKKK